MDRNQQFHSPALLPLTKAGELNLKDVLRKRGPKSHLHPEKAVSDGLPEMAESQQENASKKCRYFDYLTYFSLDYFFSNSSKRERKDGGMSDFVTQNLNPQWRVSQLISAQWSSQRCEAKTDPQKG